MPPSLTIPTTLLPSPKKYVCLFLVSALFVAGGVMLVRDGLWIGYFCGGFFALGLPIFAIQLHPKAAYLHLDLKGFTFCSLFRAHTVQWKQVSEFSVIQIGPNRMVAWNFTPGYDASHHARNLSKSISGYEAALPDTYGLKAQDLADLMNQLLEQFRAENLPPSAQTPIRHIQKSDIIGARIVEVYQTSEIVNGLDNCIIYFTVDRGFAFTTPIAGLPWESVEIPINAKLLPDVSINDAYAVRKSWLFGLKFSPLPLEKVNIVEKIKQRTIAGVYCHPLDPKLGFHSPEDGILLLDDGSQVSNTVVAPHGTGAAGLYCFTPDKCTPVSDLTDFFEIPLEENPNE